MRFIVFNGCVNKLACYAGIISRVKKFIELLGWKVLGDFLVVTYNVSKMALFFSGSFAGRFD